MAATREQPTELDVLIELPLVIAAVAEIAERARRDRDRAVELTAQDANEALYALLDAIEHRRRTRTARDLGGR